MESFFRGPELFIMVGQVPKHMKFLFPQKKKLKQIQVLETQK